MFFGVLLNSASDPLSFSKQIMTLYTIFYLCHFFPFLKHYASKNYFVALLKTKIGAHFIDINLRQKKKKKLYFFFLESE